MIKAMPMVVFALIIVGTTCIAGEGGRGWKPGYFTTVAGDVEGGWGGPVVAGASGVDDSICSIQRERWCAEGEDVYASSNADGSRGGTYMILLWYTRVLKAHRLMQRCMQ